MRIIKYDPDFDRAHEQLYFIFLRKTELQLAIQHISTAIELARPESLGRRYFLRGVAKIFAEDESALDDFESASHSGWDCSSFIDDVQNMMDKKHCLGCLIDAIQ